MPQGLALPVSGRRFFKTLSVFLNEKPAAPSGGLAWCAPVRTCVGADGPQTHRGHLLSWQMFKGVPWLEKISAQVRAPFSDARALATHFGQRNPVPLTPLDGQPPADTVPRCFFRLEGGDRGS